MILEIESATPLQLVLTPPAFQNIFLGEKHKTRNVDMPLDIVLKNICCTVIKFQWESMITAA